MSSLVRRSLRTTVAAAGIAALGVGLGGHAFAAPELPALPGADGLGAPALPDLAGMTGMLGQLPAAPRDMSDLPQLFTFEGPTVNTAGPAPAFAGLPIAPAAPGLELPALPLLAAPTSSATANGLADMDLAGTGFQTPSNEVQSPDPQSEATGALAGLDTAKMMAEMAQSAMNGQPSTSGNTIGS